MILSDDKVSHLTHLLLKGLREADVVRLKVEEEKVRKEIKRSITAFLKASEVIDEAVKKKMQSFSRKIIEGSPEWEVLYQKFYKEEAARRGMAAE